MLFVVANCCDPDAVSKNSVEEVVGKAVEVGASKIAERRMVAQWVCLDAFDGAAEFIPELVSEPIGKLVVMAEENQRCSKYLLELNHLMKVE